VMLSARVATQLTEYNDDDEYLPSSGMMTAGPTSPRPDAIAKVAETLMSSSFPVIIVGRGAIWSAAGEAIRALADRAGALIATTLLAKAWLSDDDFHVGVSGLYATRTAMELFAQADCVVSFGASLNKYTTEHGYLYPNAQIIQIDNRPHATIYGGKSSDQYVQSDAALAALALNEALTARGFKQKGFRIPEVKERLERALEDPAVFDMEPGTVDPREVCTSLEQLLPPHVGLVLGNGHQIGFGTMLFKRVRHRCPLQPAAPGRRHQRPGFGRRVPQTVGQRHAVRVVPSPHTGPRRNCSRHGSPWCPGYLNRGRCRRRQGLSDESRTCDD
jgi:acetolactate synthase-1/2/3 large subunit